MSTLAPPPGAEHIDHVLRTKLLSHAKQMVAETALETDPFPHFVVTGFFPSDVYSELIANLPDPNQYESFAYEKHQDASGTSNRFRYQFSNTWLERLPEKKRQLWFTVRSVLGSNDFKQAVFGKLAPGLMMRYRENTSDVSVIPGYALPELFRETEGYTIKPHPDTRKKVVTMQFALASNDHQRELGTEFYRRALGPQSWFRKPRGFEIVKRMPFTPNTVYAFSVLNTVRLKSWHGRTAISGAFGVRNSLLNIWYEKPDHANLELIDDAEWFASENSQKRWAA